MLLQNNVLPVCLFFGRCIQPGTLVQTGLLFSLGAKLHFWRRKKTRRTKRENIEKMKIQHLDELESAEMFQSSVPVKKESVWVAVPKGRYCLLVWWRTVFPIWFGCIEYTAEGLSPIPCETVQTLPWTFMNFPSRVFEECGVCGCGVPAQLTKERDEILAAATLETVACAVVISCMGCGKAQSSSCEVTIQHPRLKTYRSQLNQPDQSVWATCAQCA